MGRDGLASGKDVYMREGSLSSGDPAANGLLAHELTHVMQQDGGMQESVDYGEAQGGLIDWFKSKFSRKKKDSGISEPTLIGHYGVSASELTGGADPLSIIEGKKRKEAFAAAMPSLGGDDKFDADAMRQDVGKLKPTMQSEIAKDSADKDTWDGGRFYFMRGGSVGKSDGRFDYFKHLKAAGRKVNLDTMSDLAQGAEALPSVKGLGGWNGSFKGMRGLADGTTKKEDSMSDEDFAALCARAQQAYGQ